MKKNSIIVIEYLDFEDGVYVLAVLLDDVLSQILRLINLFIFARVLFVVDLLRLMLVRSRDLPFLTTFLRGEESWRRDPLRFQVCAHLWRGLVGLDQGGVGAPLRAIQTFVRYIKLLAWRPRAASSTIRPRDFRALTRI